LAAGKKDVDGRDKPGHDDVCRKASIVGDRKFPSATGSVMSVSFDSSSLIDCFLGSSLQKNLVILYALTLFE
jgi:hypothetical protein